MTREEIQEIKEDICDHYCKYSLARNEKLFVDGKEVDPREYFIGYSNVCDDCPLNRL